METIHSRPLWYAGKKRPTLQIKILQEILINGELSKIEFEKKHMRTHFHADIVSGFENLKKHKFIEESSRRCHRGRNEILYSLNTAGLVALFSENPNSSSFWKVLIYWCTSSKAPDTNTFNNIYMEFMTRLIGNTFPNSIFSPQLELFDKILVRWLEDNKIKNRSVISSSQIVLECLATNKELSFQKLREICNLSSHSLNLILDELTIKQNYSSIYYLDEADYYDIGKRTEQYLDFMMHCLIIVNKKKEIVTYQLSLIGIMLVLALIGYSKMDLDVLSQNLGISFVEPIELFHSVPIQNYYDEIASIHEDKLPLIFGIWSSLKEILGGNLVYLLNALIDKNSRAKALGSPLFLGGVSEVYEDIKGIMISNQSKLADICNEGIKHLGRVFNEKDNQLIKKLQLVYQKYKEIELLLGYSYVTSYLDLLENENYSSEYNWQVEYNNHANFIVSSLNEEIFILFYLNLAKSNKQVLLPLKSRMDSSEFIPRQGLFKIIKKHTLVKAKVDGWIREIKEYHRMTSDLMDDFLALEGNQILR